MSTGSPLGSLVAGLFPAASGTALTAAAQMPTPPVATTAPATTAPAPASSGGTRKLWDLEHKHHCPIIGTCLGVDELQRFARRHDFAGNRNDAFAMHVEAASRAGTRNALSQDIQKHLDRKFAAVVSRFAALSDDAAVADAWQSHLARGEVAGPLWATLTHRAASAATRQRVYADIHMLSHQVGAGQAADTRRLAHLERENVELTASAARAQRLRADAESTLRGELQTAEQRIRQLESEIAEFAPARQRLAELETGMAIVELGRRLMALSAANAQLLTAAQRSAELERSLDACREDLRLATRQRDLAQRERDALEHILLASPPPTDDAAATRCGGDCTVCPAPAQTRCVLCVGGRTALVAQYRTLAERLGIRLIHHDGGQEEAISRLPDLINSADAVICPTDCVSHAAYYRLKSHCKRTGKTCLLFKGAGVSGVATALSRLAAGDASLAPPPSLFAEPQP